MKGKFTRPAFTACLIIYTAPAVAQNRTDAQRTDRTAWILLVTAISPWPDSRPSFCRRKAAA